jgi:hypothetical protein
MINDRKSFCNDFPLWYERPFWLTFIAYWQNHGERTHLKTCVEVGGVVHVWRQIDKRIFWRISQFDEIRSIIVCSSVRSTIEGVKTCFPLSFSGVLESTGMNPISVSSCPFASKNIEKLQMNINGYKLSNYKYPLNCNISL